MNLASLMRFKIAMMIASRHDQWPTIQAYCLHDMSLKISLCFSFFFCTHPFILLNLKNACSLQINHLTIQEVSNRNWLLQKIAFLLPICLYLFSLGYCRWQIDSQIYLSQTSSHEFYGQWMRQTPPTAAQAPTKTRRKTPTSLFLRWCK